MRNLGDGMNVRKLIVASVCVLVMLASLIYIFHYEITRREILRSNDEFSALYEASEITPIPTSAPESTASSTPSPTDAPTPEPTLEIAVDQLFTPDIPIILDATLAPVIPVLMDETLAPTVPAIMDETRATALPIIIDTTRAPHLAADDDTLVFAMETPPPVQESFAGLLAANSESVGFLTIENVLSLPVVQRANDNDFYLNHSFDLEESDAGTLFLDGSNLLTPEDDCLIIYGHNMRNGTMFRKLVNYEELDFVKENALVRFDTLYENRIYVPFAALTVTADLDSKRYLNLRQFTFDELGFDLFVRSLRTLSMWQNPVDVEYGDEVLLLVTCEYTHDNGRFVLALRAQRDDESWDQLWAQVQDTKLK